MAYDKYIQRRRDLTLRDDHSRALRIRIALVSGCTGAHGQVIDHSALCVHAARSRTRIDAPLIGAHQVLGAVVVAGALRPAVGRSADVVGQTAAGGLAADVAALGVRAARRRIAGQLVANGRRQGGNYMCGSCASGGCLWCVRQCIGWFVGCVCK